jgi:CubicO group peptidase (beta-lactamase class C family)
MLRKVVDCQLPPNLAKGRLMKWAPHAYVSNMLLPALLALVPMHSEALSGKWLIEVERQDSPILLAVEFGESVVQVRRQNWAVKATMVKVSDNTFTINFPANLLVGAGEMRLKVLNGTVAGQLETSQFRESVTGIPEPKPSSPPVAKPPVNGPGFTALDLPGKMATAKTAGLSIARFRDGRVVEEGFYGVDNAASGIPVTANTRFQAGGMGSVLTCLAALRLAGLGNLTLTDTVASIFPEIKLAAKDGKEIRVLDLLRGSSGLGQYKFRGYRQTQNMPSLSELLKGADPAQLGPLEIVSPIGEQNGFNGINHALLQAVLERRTRKSFNYLMQDLLLRPLRMSHSTFELRPRERNDARFAIGHYETGEPLLFGNHIYPMLGDSGLWTTAPDMALALIEAGRLLAGKPNRILPPEKMNLLALVEGPKGVAGFVRGDSDLFFHGGDTYGQFSTFSLRPQNGTGVVLMSNRVMNWKLVNQVIGQIENR